MCEIHSRRVYWVLSTRKSVSCGAGSATKLHDFKGLSVEGGVQGRQGVLAKAVEVTLTIDCLPNW